MFGLFKKKPEAVEFKPERSQLVPRIKHQAFLRAMQEHGVPAAAQPATHPLCGELLVTYAFDLPDSFVMATPGLLEQAGVGAAELEALALANLQRQLPQPKFFAKDGCGLAYTGDGLEATLLLVDSVWDGMLANFRGSIVAVAPQRDRILMCDSADADAVAALRRQAAGFFEEARAEGPHALSTQLMVRGAGGWTLFGTH